MKHSLTPCPVTVEIDRCPDDGEEPDRLSVMVYRGAAKIIDTYVNRGEGLECVDDLTNDEASQARIVVDAEWLKWPAHAGEPSGARIIDLFEALRQSLQEPSKC